MENFRSCGRYLKVFVGFSDQPNFNFFFKKYTGVTPNTYRKTAIR